MGEGPLVILLHGFPDQRDTWRHQLPALAQAGFRAIAPSLRGYEPSSQPENGQYRVAFLAADVVGWIADLGVEKAHLVGHDWGAVVANAAANLMPNRVASLSTLTVPPLHHIPAMIRHRPKALFKLWYMALFQTRRFPEHLIADPKGRLIRRLWSDWSPSWTCPEAEMRSLIAAMRAPGVASAALAYYRQMPDMLSFHGRRSWALLQKRVEVPTLTLCGDEDGCIHPDVYEVGLSPKQFSAELRHERVMGVGHFLHQEAPEVVNRHLIEWISRNAE